MQPFTKQVIEIIQNIPPGKVMTYGQIAEAAGSKRAARQVVRILHTMSRKYALPWHRVVNVKGEIAIKDDEARFTQIALLEEEGVFVDAEGRVDLEVYRNDYHAGAGLFEVFRNEIVAIGILDESYNTLIPLKGGTNSMVGTLSSDDDAAPRYVIKANTMEQIEAEAKFLQLYRSMNLLPRVLYVDPKDRYFVYEYIPGEVVYDRQSKRGLMLEVVERMIKYYVKPDASDEYEWVEAPNKVVDDLRYTQSIIGTHLSDDDHKLVRDVHERRIGRISGDDVYILHGDFGVHNFLFENGELVGIIDPIPSIGRRLYDLLYAFCSSPDDLTLPILQGAVERLGVGALPTHDLIEDMVIALYSRIGTCIVHHAEDLQPYVSAWSEWKAMLFETEQY